MRYFNRVALAVSISFTILVRIRAYYAEPGCEDHIIDPHFIRADQPGCEDSIREQFEFYKEYFRDGNHDASLFLSFVFRR